MDIAARHPHRALPTWHPVSDGQRRRTAMTAETDRERELVARARAGDRDAFEQLVLLHADRLYAVVLRMSGEPDEAEELVQETFLRAWRNVDRFEGRSQFFTWLYRIAINEARRSHARRGTRPQSAPLADAAADIPDERQAPHERAQAHELRWALERAILQLPIEQRMPLVLRDVEGLTTEEAAAVMDLGEAAFKSRLHRARMAVREAVEHYVARETDS
jgi:RNA polymerase sigma-70 factor (ECF subfamily)